VSMSFPVTRLRRLRRTDALRGMVRETRLSAADLIQPLFVRTGSGPATPIASLAGQFHHSIETLVGECAAVHAAGVPAVMLFGLPDHKDEVASSAYDQEGVVQMALRAVRARVPELVLITDVCLCQYTSHGHCGVLRDGQVDNDATLELLSQTAVSHALAGADIVAPSDMMDGRVAAIRAALDGDGLTSTAILAYSAKFASAFYGPFRDAAHSTPQEGDRRGYQMDPANGNEALREVLADIGEGADMVMVKPAMPYLDVIRRVREQTLAPIAAYQVSGEYAMLATAAREGLLDEREAALEALTSIKRAGADMIITYHATRAAGWLS
jgi:porphobilinogen synthase